ncbi:hypothetical protein ACET3Z_020123 [Daucus carota]
MNVWIRSLIIHRAPQDWSWTSIFHCQPLAYGEAVRLINPVNPELNGENSAFHLSQSADATGTFKSITKRVKKGGAG